MSNALGYVLSEDGVASVQTPEPGFVKKFDFLSYLHFVIFIISIVGLTGRPRPTLTLAYLSVGIRYQDQILTVSLSLHKMSIMVALVICNVKVNTVWQSIWHRKEFTITEHCGIQLQPWLVGRPT